MRLNLHLGVVFLELNTISISVEIRNSTSLSSIQQFHTSLIPINGQLNAGSAEVSSYPWSLLSL